MYVLSAVRFATVMGCKDCTVVIGAAAGMVSPPVGGGCSLPHPTVAYRRWHEQQVKTLTHQDTTPPTQTLHETAVFFFFFFLLEHVIAGREGCVCLESPRLRLLFQPFFMDDDADVVVSLCHRI